MSTSRTSTETSRKSWIFFRILDGILAKTRIIIFWKRFPGRIVDSWVMTNVLSGKNFAAFLVRTETFSWSLEKNECDLAWHALITPAFLPPPVLKVISCDYVSVHPGLGVMGGVESFRVVCSAVWLPMHRASASSSCWFSLRKGAIHTSG